jgi:excisionase family DNA binding protein
LFYSLSEAADEIGLSKMTIQRAIKKGRLSADRDEQGAYRIDPAELHRVFPKNARAKPEQGKSNKASQEPSQSESLLRREIEIRDEKLDLIEKERRREREQLETTIDDLRKRLDTESAERQRLTLLITDQRTKDEEQAREEAEASAKAKPKKRIFGWRER